MDEEIINQPEEQEEQVETPAENPNEQSGPSADRSEYTPTTWVNDVTKLNATNMNHIESGVKQASDLAYENAQYLDELEVAIANKLDIKFDNVNNELTLSVGYEDDGETAACDRYKYKKTLQVEPNHKFATTDEINNLFV